jgi:hypothetical protein
MLNCKRWCIYPFGKMIGFERSTIFINLDKYMDRWIVYTGFGTLRLHKFYRGDDDRASHTHPWWFITFPLGVGYLEELYAEGRALTTRWVQPWRFHYRPADFEHIVLVRADSEGSPDISGAPFWTFVITGERVNHWGFYPQPGRFVYWRNYK